MTFYRAYFVMRGGGTSMLRMSGDLLRSVIDAWGSGEKSPSGSRIWVEGGGRFAVDLDDVASIYSTDDGPNPHEKSVEALEKMASAVARDLNKGDEWKEGDE